MVETLAHAADKLRSAIGSTTSCMTTDALLTIAKLDHVNPYTLLQWASEHKIVHKAAGAYASAQGTLTTRGSLYALLSFLRAVGSDAGQGCVLCDEQALRYILLDASAPFSDVVARAHSVVLASGTLSPIDALTTQLFGGSGASGLPKASYDNCVIHSFGHVVPEANLMTAIVSTAPNGRALDLRYHSRQLPDTLAALQSTIHAVAQCVPHGMVVFFPSFRYMRAAMAAGVGCSAGKPLFTEPSDAADVPRVLAAYAAQSAQSPGALLLSVCGGKLSEGINFGDRLGRCVVVVGLPYPDANGPEMQQRLSFAAQRGARQAVYDGACFTAVNQCVGRVLRHANDYAAIVLLDGRYAAAVDKLPRWVVGGALPSVTCGEVVGRLKRFFACRECDESVPY